MNVTLRVIVCICIVFIFARIHSHFPTRRTNNNGAHDVHDVHQFENDAKEKLLFEKLISIPSFTFGHRIGW